MAPQGQDTLIAIVPVGHMCEDGEQDWSGFAIEARGHVFADYQLWELATLNRTSSLKSISRRPRGANVTT